MSNIENDNKLPIKIIFIVLALINIFSFAFYFFIRSNYKVNQFKQVDSNPTNPAYFVPPDEKDTSTKREGTVSIIPEAIRNSKSTHALYSNNTKKKIAELYSDNHDLGLFSGLSIKVEGNIVGKSIDGVDLIEVKTISLK